MLQSFPRSNIFQLSLLFACVLLASLAGYQTSDLLPVANTDHPIIDGRNMLLALWVWLLALVGSLLIFAPGFFLVMAFDSNKLSLGSLLLKGFIVNLFLLTFLIATTEYFLTKPLSGPAFAIFLGAISAIAFSLLCYKARQPDFKRVSGIVHTSDIIAMLAAPLAVLIVLFPKFAWESFTEDGAHIFHSMRLLIYTGIPFWPEAAGDNMYGYPSKSTLLEIYTGSWFVRLFGETELATRLAVLPGLAILTAVILEFCRRESRARLPIVQIFAICGFILVYAMVLGFHSGYNPYYADIALPFGREPWVMIAFLGLIYFFLQDKISWFFVFTLLTFMAIPSAPLLIIFFLAGVVLVWRPVPWRKLFVSLILISTAYTLVSILPDLVSKFTQISLSDEFDSGSIARRLRYLTLFEWNRLLFLIFPVGILPAIALFTWGWQDRTARVLALIAVCYAGFFYLMAYRVLLHHFAPVMVLQVIVFWRLSIVNRWPKVLGSIALIGIVISLYAAMPLNWNPDMYSREFAQRIHIENSDYDDLSYSEFDIAQQLLEVAFPMNHSDEGPEIQYIGSPLGWYTYAALPKPNGVKLNYIIRKGNVQANEHLLAEHDGYVLTTLDKSQYEADRVEARHLHRSINNLYFVKRHTIFGHGARGAPRPVLDIARLLGLR